MDGTGDVEEGHNVIRLPREWIGPYEELIPIGSRADREREARADRERASHRHGEADDADDEQPDEIPGASSFWTEGATALHHPLKAPDPRPRPHERPRFRGLGDRPRRPILAAAVVAIVAIVAVAVIGASEGPSRSAVHSRAAAQGAVSRISAQGDSAGVALARAPARPRPEPQSIGHEVSDRRARHPQRHRSRPQPSRRSGRASSTPTRTVVTTTVTTPAPSTPVASSAPTTPVQTPTEPVATSAGYRSSSSASGGGGTHRGSSTAPAGPTGAGSAQGCDPKCS